jgi:hypothetical protein
MRIYTSIATDNLKHNYTPVDKIHQIIIDSGNTHTNSWNTAFYKGTKLPPNKGTEQRIKNEIFKSDLMIAEISIPSFGVGYFVSLARISKLPIVCLYHSKYKQNTSAFLHTIIDKDFILIEYNDSSLEERLTNALKNFIPKKKRFNFNLDEKYYRQLNRISKEKNTTITDLLHQIISKNLDSTP